MEHLIAWFNDTRGRRAIAAKMLHITMAAITQWENRGKIPPEYVLDLERLTGITRYQLRPDIYGEKRERAK